MRIGVPRERLANEARVAATPKTVEQLLKLGFTVAIERGAGKLASFEDVAYEAAGAALVDESEVWQSDLILKVNAPQDDEIALMREGSTLVSFIWPAQNPELMAKLAARNVTALAMDSVPRISRAQSMDALSSMANIAGYRAIVEAAHEFGRFFTGQITAAGKVPPAKVMIIGAGVAGLAAIGAAGSLGAIVRAFDTRPEVKEQVQSMGAEFLELDFEEEAGSGDGYAKVMSEAFIKAEMALFAAQAAEVDIIVTTALIPGKPAPKLITKEMVASMKPGSVIVDLAAQTGGNCELTVADTITVTDNGVKIIGYTDLPSRLPTQSSQLYGTNLVNLLKLLSKEKNGEIDIDFDDTVIRGVTVVRCGEITAGAADPGLRPAESGARRRTGRQTRSQTDLAVAEVWPDGSGDPAVRLAGGRGAERVPVALYRVRAGLRGRLLRGLERQPCAAYPVDVGHQRDLRDYRGRRAVADRPWRLGEFPLLYRRADRQHQYFRWVHRHSAHAEDVPQELRGSKCLEDWLQLHTLLPLFCLFSAWRACRAMKRRSRATCSASPVWRSR